MAFVSDFTDKQAEKYVIGLYASIFVAEKQMITAGTMGMRSYLQRSIAKYYESITFYSVQHPNINLQKLKLKAKELV